MAHYTYLKVTKEHANVAIEYRDALKALIFPAVNLAADKSASQFSAAAQVPEAEALPLSELDGGGEVKAIRSRRWSGELKVLKSLLAALHSLRALADLEIEQQLDPVILIAPSSVVQVLHCYFANSPVSEASEVVIPRHSVEVWTPSGAGFRRQSIGSEDMCV
ncbi:unnamed protein product [Prorocentrum cordatum]|uniref:Uncharacterized protein n=1 Tax=Prorocentrum cordatum TaxID=2364126 RepID=A0ABN9QZP1_9DINO|nr:unnamed protein product [Polarella glacialis]